MIVMPASCTGWFWHCLARETGRLGHLISPRQQRGPWPWFPYALDNGAFSCWNPKENTFDEAKWEQMQQAWRELLFWTQVAPSQAMWARDRSKPAVEIAAQMLAVHIRRVELGLRRDWMEAKAEGREGTMVACENALQYLRGEDLP